MVTHSSHDLRQFLAQQPSDCQLTGMAYCVVPSSQPENSNPAITKGMTITGHGTVVVIDGQPYFLNHCFGLPSGGRAVVIAPHPSLADIFVIMAGKDELASIRVATPSTEAATPAA